MSSEETPAATTPPAAAPAENAEGRTRSASAGSAGSGTYDDTGPQKPRRQRRFSASETGRTIVIAVDESEDAKFAFECQYSNVIDKE